ncbi:hypothetical protein HDU76_002130, partial [Blyttiomyces sp. JEL0837]
LHPDLAQDILDVEERQRKRVALVESRFKQASSQCESVYEASVKAANDTLLDRQRRLRQDLIRDVSKRKIQLEYEYRVGDRIHELRDTSEFDKVSYLSMCRNGMDPYDDEGSSTQPHPSPPDFGSGSRLVPAVKRMKRSTRGKNSEVQIPMFCESLAEEDQIADLALFRILQQSSS